MERKNAWLTYSEKQAEALEALSASYKAFLDHGKTEREESLNQQGGEKVGHDGIHNGICLDEPACGEQCFGA